MILKFGCLSFEKTVNWYWDNSWNNRALLNIGDAAEYKVVEQILAALYGSESIFKLCINDLINYRGEDLIVPLNIALDSYVGYNSILENLSPNIIPVFLGMSFTDTNLNSKQINCLRRFQPIGCRDERSYKLMCENNIEAYLNGCMVSILNVNAIVNYETSVHNKVLFIDVPSSIVDYIPDSIKNEICFVNQELYIKSTELNDYSNPDNWFKSVLEQYSKARLIVTSRFHGAVIALAMKIPVILTLEKKTFRFSWLSNFCQIVTTDDFSSINWNPEVIDFSEEKSLIEKIARDRIIYANNYYNSFPRLTSLMQDKCIEERENSNQVYYYYKVMKRIMSEWNENDELQYALWGLNDNAFFLYNFIQENYPKAKLVAVLDMYKDTEFMGIKSIKPSQFIDSMNNKCTYLIVTAYLASRVVTDIFGNDNSLLDRIYKCERDFLTLDDILQNQ